MDKTFKYSYGLPFSEFLTKSLNSLYRRVEIGKASMVIIDGEIGEGKTTYGVHIADYYNKMYGLPTIDLKKNNHPQLACGGGDFVKKMRECYDKGLPVIIYDEAGDFNKRGSLTQFNAMLNRTFEMYRAFKIIIILCLPTMAVLDDSLFLKGIPRILINVKKRNYNQGNFSLYSLYRMFYIRDKMKKLIVKPFAYQIVNDNVRGHFLDLEPRRALELNDITIENKKEFLMDSQRRMEGLMNYIEIAHKVVRSVCWVRNKVNKLKLKPAAVMKKQKYFKEDVVNTLVDYIGSKGK